MHDAGMTWTEGGRRCNLDIQVHDFLFFPLSFKTKKQFVSQFADFFSWLKTSTVKDSNQQAFTAERLMGFHITDNRVFLQEPCWFICVQVVRNLLTNHQAPANSLSIPRETDGLHYSADKTPHMTRVHFHNLWNLQRKRWLLKPTELWGAADINKKLLFKCHHFI